MDLIHIAEAAHWAQARSTGRYDRSTRGVSTDEVGFLRANDGAGQVTAVSRVVYAAVRTEY